MRSRNGDFSLYQRKINNNKLIYYYWCYDEDGKRIYRSTGKEKYEDAVKKCRELMKTNSLYIPKDMAFNIVFQNYFIYDICPYIAQLKLRNRSYSRTWAERQRSLLVKYMFKRFGSVQVSAISHIDIQDWLNNLAKDGICHKTANHIITTMRVMFSFIQMKGFIYENPMRFIRPYIINSKEKGVFTKEELAELFDAKNKELFWKSEKHYLINILACMTGMRLGELQALHKDELKETYLEIRTSWNPLDKIKCTKTGNIRKIPVDLNILQKIKKIGEQSESGLIFSNDIGMPLDHKTIYKYFYYAMDSIGINPEMRLLRNITFHSYRHTFNTFLLEAGIHPEIVRLYTGHNTKLMTQHYAHVNPNELPSLWEKLLR